MSGPAWSQVIERNRRRRDAADGGGSSTLQQATDAADRLRRQVTDVHTGLRRNSPVRAHLRQVDAALGVAILRARQLSLPLPGAEVEPLPRLLLELKAIRREHDRALSDSGLRDALDRVISAAGGGR